jgi:DNA helicase-2/ATP-dependent DNA helicase PcrA
VSDLLGNLDPEQRAVAQTLRGPLCVIAGAGTGKTRAITHRIAYGVASGVYQPREVLAVTFTTRAAGEMRGRLAGLGAAGVQARTFHSAALRQARYFWPLTYGTVFPEIVQSKFGLVAEAVRRVGVPGEQSIIRDLAAEIEWAKVSNVGAGRYPAAAARNHREVGELDLGEVSNVISAYEDIKRERGRIDMEDILLVTAAILADDDRAAAQVRRQYRWFVVDEFQDVNPLQAMLLDLWLGGRDDICVVGDPRQTIYSFAGASPRILGGFVEKYPDAEQIELVRNYRSTPQIIQVANSVFTGSSQAGVQLTAQSEPGDLVRSEGFTDEPAEAAGVADAIAELHRRGVPYREMAVLFRINAQSEPFEEALGQLGIPYSLRGVEGFFQRAEVRQAVALIRAAARAGGDQRALVDEVRGILASVGYTDEAPHGAGAVRDRWESLRALVTMAEDLGDADLAAFAEDLERRAETAHAPTADGVTLATLHAAKGLEWDAVFCVGMHEGMMPSVHADTPAAVDEERRLFYVGVTRARRWLSVSWSASRKPGGRGNRGPTRFLDAVLPREHVAVKPKPKAKKAAAVDSLDAESRELFERLRAWRSEAADGKPAFVVFTDATLVEIARTKPSDQRQLLAVPGVGPSKWDRFGPAVLELVRGN